MSYSRWINDDGSSCHWYTFWHYQEPGKENGDTAIFSIHSRFDGSVFNCSAKQLRESLDDCMAQVHFRNPDGDIAELAGYARRFLSDVDAEYHGLRNE